MRLYTIVVFTFLCSSFLISCKGKEEAKRLVQLNVEAEQLLVFAQQNYKGSIYRLSYEIQNRGTRPEEETILNAAKRRDSLYLLMQDEIAEYKTSFLKRYNKNSQDFDTLDLLNKVSIGKEFIDTLNLRLNKIISGIGHEKMHHHVQQAKRKYDYLKTTSGTFLIEMPSQPVNIATARAMLTALQIELLSIASLDFFNIRKSLTPELNFSISKPIVRPVSNVVNEGETYEADVFFISSPVRYTQHKFEIKVNGKNLPVEGNKAMISFPVKANTFDKNGLCKKTWEGDVLVQGKAFDFPYHIKEEYFVKKKCDAK